MATKEKRLQPQLADTGKQTGSASSYAAPATTGRNTAQQKQTGLAGPNTMQPQTMKDPAVNKKTGLANPNSRNGMSEDDTVYVGPGGVDPKQKQNPYNGGPYNGLGGVSSVTSRKMGESQDYNESENVRNARALLDQMQNSKPQGYSSKYGQQLDGLLQKITNPEEFKYEFNADNLFQSYKDYYTQLGKQASLDAQGQAAGLTGGYGNSYAQAAGNQAYQQNLLGLYDKGMDLYDRAYQRYRDSQGDLYNQYNLLSGQDQLDYGRYRDTVGDWQNERDYLAGRYDTETERDYNRYTNNRDYWTQLAQIENADYRSEQERQEAIRQFEKNFAEQQRQYDQNFGEQQRQYDLDFNENKRRYDQDFNEQQRQYDLNFGENKRQYDQNYYEQQRQFDLNFNQQQKEYDQNFLEQQRQFNEQQKMDQMKYYSSYVTSMLENGQMPSESLLMAVGLSQEDAQKLLKQIQNATGGKKKGNTTNTDQADNSISQQDVVDWWTNTIMPQLQRNAEERLRNVNNVNGNNGQKTLNLNIRQKQ